MDEAVRHAPSHARSNRTRLSEVARAIIDHTLRPPSSMWCRTSRAHDAAHTLDGWARLTTDDPDSVTHRDRHCPGGAHSGCEVWCVACGPATVTGEVKVPSIVGLPDITPTCSMHAGGSRPAAPTTCTEIAPARRQVAEHRIHPP